MINIRNRWTPMAKMLIITYLSCVSMVLPQSYVISYMAFGVTHLMVELVRRRLEERKRENIIKEIFK